MIRTSVIEMEYNDAAANYLTMPKDIEKRLLETYQEYANSWCTIHGLEFIKVKFNGRIKTSLGRYNQVFRRGELTEWIDLSKTQAVMDLHMSTENTLDTLVHELTHYQVKCEGGDYNDGTRDFEQALADNHAASSGATKAANKVTETPLAYYETLDVYTAENIYTGELVGKVARDHAVKPLDRFGYRVKGVQVKLTRVALKINAIRG